MTSLIPAAQYLRMSTDHQQYSLDSQRAQIQLYAQQHGFEIIKSYVDSGKSGVVLAHRDALERLLEDAANRRADFRAVLVYDISRWGRFQDGDEAAHYEFICRQSGIQVHYCAEPFPNDGSASSSILKAMKRGMAGEFSRQLGANISATMLSMAEKGLWRGGWPGFGLRRAVVTSTGHVRKLLEPGERKSFPSDQVRLVLGPEEEVRSVREVFRIYTAGRGKISQTEVAADLNRRGFKYIGMRPWNRGAVTRILTDKRYAGGLASAKPHDSETPGFRHLPEGHRIGKPNCIPPIIDQRTFDTAQELLRVAKQRFKRRSDEELLNGARRTLERGKLSTKYLSRKGRPPSVVCYATIARRFGGLRQLRDLIGCKPEAISTSWRRRNLRLRLRNTVIKQFQQAIPEGLSAFKPVTNREDILLLLDEQFKILVRLCLTQARSWRYDHRRGVKADLVLVALANEAVTRVQAYYLLPASALGRRALLNEGGRYLSQGVRITSPSELCQSARRLIESSAIEPSVDRPTAQQFAAAARYLHDFADTAVLQKEQTQTLHTGQLIPVAQYLRSSSRWHRDSIAAQKEMIRRYAEKHGFIVIQSYQDANRSGLSLRRRSGLAELLKNVVSGEARYKAILVQDVSRWGRFQDNDEGAHYEFVCAQAGIPVHYCAEVFNNDRSLPTYLFKSIKRMMAAEFSREMGVKISAARRRIAEAGYSPGALPGFALRRMEVNPEGQPIRLLAAGDRKGFRSSKIALVHGPAEEVACVRQIFQMYLEGKGDVSCGRIAEALNEMGIPSATGRPWSYLPVRSILTNPKYMGCMAWDRTVGRLRSPQQKVPPDQWVMKYDAFAPIVSRTTFEEVQRLLATRMRLRTQGRYSNDQLLEALRRALESGQVDSRHLWWKRRGRGEEFLPCAETYVRRFGGIGNAFEMIGRPHAATSILKREHIHETRQLQSRICRQLCDRFPSQLCAGRTCRSAALLLDHKISLSVWACRCLKTSSTRHIWHIRSRADKTNGLVLLCLLTADSQDVSKYYLLPRFRINFRTHKTYEEDPFLRAGIQFADLSELCDMAHHLIRTTSLDSREQETEFMSPA